MVRWTGHTFIEKMKRYFVGTQMRPEEYQAFLEGFKHSLCKKKSHYARRLLLGKPVSVIYRNRSLDDFIEMVIGLRKDLRDLRSKENFSASEKEMLNQLILGVQGQLIKFIDICNHTLSEKKTS